MIHHTPALATAYTVDLSHCSRKTYKKQFIDESFQQLKTKDLYTSLIEKSDTKLVLGHLIKFFISFYLYNPFFKMKELIKLFLTLMLLNAYLSLNKCFLKQFKLNYTLI